MKRLVAVFAVVALQLGPAQGADMKDMGKSGQTESQGRAHKASGIVTKVDQAGGKVTISHGPVPSLNWPAMTMNFVVKDKALLGRLPSGRKIEFEFVQQGRDYVIISAK